MWMEYNLLILQKILNWISLDNKYVNGGEDFTDHRVCLFDALKNKYSIKENNTKIMVIKKVNTVQNFL